MTYAIIGLPDGTRRVVLRIYGPTLYRIVRKS